MAGASCDRELAALRAERRAAGGGAIEVLAGDPRSSVVHLDSLVENARFELADGSAWTGRLEVGPDGAISPPATGPAPRVRGAALLTGAPLTAQGFRHGLPGEWGDLVVTITVILFAVSTGISWSYYGDRATEYLVGAWAIPIYRWIFVAFFFTGAILPLQAVWKFGDVALGLMTFPNLVALILLTGQVARMTREYFSREHVPFREERARAAKGGR
jgi:AGCS family alanine or glycine:cation symporter